MLVPWLHLHSLQAGPCYRTTGFVAGLMIFFFFGSVQSIFQHSSAISREAHKQKDMGKIFTVYLLHCMIQNSLHLQVNKTSLYSSIKIKS